MPKLQKRVSNLKQYDKMELENREPETESEIETDNESDDEYFCEEAKNIDEPLIAEIVHFILNETASMRSLSVLVFAILKYV